MDAALRHHAGDPSAGVATLKRHVLVLALVPFAAMAETPKADDDPVFDNHLTLSGSFAYASASTQIRLDASDGTRGTDLDGETDLGLSKHKWLGRGEATLRPRPRHRLRLTHHFLKLERNGTATLTRDVAFGDEDFLAGEIVTSNLDLSLLALDYSYSFWRSPRVELAAGIGINLADYEVRAAVPAGLREERDDESGYAPVLSLEGAFRFGGRWYGEARVRYFELGIDHVRGSLATWDVNVLYRLKRNVLVGAGYSRFDLAVESNRTGDTGRLDLAFDGPQLFLRAGF